MTTTEEVIDTIETPVIPDVQAIDPAPELDSATAEPTKPAKRRRGRPQVERPAGMTKAQYYEHRKNLDGYVKAILWITPEEIELLKIFLEKHRAYGILKNKANVMPRRARITKPDSELRAKQEAEIAAAKELQIKLDAEALEAEQALAAQEALEAERAAAEAISLSVQPVAFWEPPVTLQELRALEYTPDDDSAIITLVSEQLI
jgi:hypothetical protein